MRSVEEACYFCGKELTEPRRQGSRQRGRNATEKHHISYDPEITVLVHKKCHTRHRNKQFSLERDEKGRFVKKNLTKPELFGEEPDCYLCGKPITIFSGQESESLCTHHINGDHSDNRRENLASAHFGCHSGHHNKKNPRNGWTITEEHKQKISNYMSNRIVSLETRKKISRAKKGKSYEELVGLERAREWKRKVSKTRKRVH